MRMMTTSIAALALVCGGRWANAATILPAVGQHAGTATDPWPGSAIQAAIASASGGDVVYLQNGVWSISTQLSNTTGNFTLQGQSTDAKLVFTDGGGLTLGTQSGNVLINNVTITGLTFDASQLTSGTAVTINDCFNCSFSGNYVRTGGIYSQALFFFGGANVRISGNRIAVQNSSGGGTQLQINPAGGYVTTAIPMNTGYDIYGNHVDSTGFLIIGMSEIRIHENYFTNTFLAQPAGILFTPPFGGISRNIVISNNMLDLVNNFGVITGTPEDDIGGLGQGTVDGLVISGNVIKASTGFIAVNSYDQSCLNSCTMLSKSYNVSIVHNVIQSAWGGSQINIAGGVSGLVQNSIVQGNILTWQATTSGVITTDSNTTITNIANNVP